MTEPESSRCEGGVDWSIESLAAGDSFPEAIAILGFTCLKVHQNAQFEAYITNFLVKGI